LSSEHYFVVKTHKQTKEKYILDTLYFEYYRNGNLKVKNIININENDSLLYEKYIYRRKGSLKTKIISYKGKKRLKQKYTR